MVALAKQDGCSARGVDSATSRVRKHLHMVPRQSSDGGREDRQLTHDLLGLLSRLRRVQARGGIFEQVDLSPQVGEVFRALKIVGNELLVLDPERKKRA